MSSSPRTKTCKDCGSTLPIDDFPYQAGRRLPRCRPCHRGWKGRYKEGERHQPMRGCEVPADPFVAWARAFVVRAGSEGEAALLMGVNPRQLYRWVKRPIVYIEETTIDKVFCQVGKPYLLRELYPELYGEVAA